MKRFFSILICVLLLCSVCLPVIGANAEAPYRTLTIQDYGLLKTLYVYTWDSEDLGIWPGTPLKRSGDVYMLTVKSSMTNLIISGEDFDGNLVQYDAMQLQDNSRDVTVCLWPGIGTEQFYDDDITSRFTKFLYDLGARSCYRVTGNADWLNFRKTDDKGVDLNQIEPGVFRKTFYNVEPGTYSMKIAEDGKWDEAYGDVNGNDYRFTVLETSSLSVQLNTVDGQNVVSVHGPQVLSISPVPRLPGQSGGSNEADVSVLTGLVVCSMPIFLFGIVSLVVYWLFLLRRRNQYTGNVTPDGQVHRRRQLTTRTATQVVKEAVPQPSNGLDDTVWSSIRKVKEAAPSAETEDAVWRSVRKVMEPPPHVQN